MKKRTIGLLTAAMAGYILLLLLLTASEKASPGANIRSFFDAFWYSLVTLTTIGYGDLYPVSPAGRIIGLIFILLSMGVLAAILSAAASALRRQLVPALRLRLFAQKHCAVFSVRNPAADTLARDLLLKEPDIRMIFCETDPSRFPTRKNFRSRVLCVPQEADEIAQKIESTALSCRVFLISEDTSKNEAGAEKLKGFSGAVYCRGMEKATPGSAHYFDEYACCARLYWQAHPLDPRERVIILAGDGMLARAILDQAVLVNCRIPFASTAYHAFGDWTEYRDFHPALRQVFGETESGPHDSLLFHAGSWLASSALLKQADRILFCGDDPAENARNAALFSRYLPASASPHVAAPGGEIDCTNAVFTRELVTRSELDRMARLLHAAYCRNHPEGAEAWDCLPYFTKESNRASGDHLLTKLRLLLSEAPPAQITPESCREAALRWQKTADREPCRKNEHERWMRFYALYNWQYGPAKDAVLRTHPCMVPYEQLSEAEKAKDDNAWDLIGTLYSAEDEA